MPQESDHRPRSTDDGCGVSSNNERVAMVCRPWSVVRSQVRYCANANASDKAPLPSLLKKSNAWLRRLCWISSTNCCLTSCWFMIFENCIKAKIILLKIKKRPDLSERFFGRTSILIQILCDLFTHWVHFIMEYCN